MKKQIGYIENLLIAECKKDEPNFMQINRLFELGADPNAVNEYGETVMAVLFDSFCAEGEEIKKATYAPQIVLVFLMNGFDVRKNALRAISAMQNNVYDRNMRVAMRILLNRRRDVIKEDCKTLHLCIKAIGNKVFRRHKIQTA